MEYERNTREKILDAAKLVFTEKGYQASGLREIAKTAGVTTGAMYGYFRNKEELFEELVKQPYDIMVEKYRILLRELAELGEHGQKEMLKPKTKDGLLDMAEYMFRNRETFKLILCCSEGTVYNGLIHRLARMNTDASACFVQIYENQGKPLRKINPFLEHMLVSGLFTTFFELIIHDIPREDAEEYVEQMLEFYIGGWREIMGMSPV